MNLLFPFISNFSDLLNEPTDLDWLPAVTFPGTVYPLMYTMGGGDGYGKGYGAG